MTIDTQIEAARAEVDKVQLCAVSFHLNEASHNATAAYWADDCRDFLAAKMLDGIKKALGELGFDIVERTPSADADQLPEAAEFKPSLELIDKCADAVKARAELREAEYNASALLASFDATDESK